MTNDGDTLFQAICAKPWEDTPRLMYADWLDEWGVYNGRENPNEAHLHAAFIRHQIAMTRGDERAVLSHPMLMYTKFRGCVERWTAELPYLPNVNWHSQFFQRGFVSGASFSTTGAFDMYAANVFALAPISHLRLYQMIVEALPRVVESDLLRRVAILDASGSIGDVGVKMIAECPHLRDLTELRLVGIGMTDDGFEALASTESLPALEILSFDANRISDRGVSVLLKSNTLRSLTTIGWRDNPLSRKTVLALRKRYRDIFTGPPPV